MSLLDPHSEPPSPEAPPLDPALILLGLNSSASGSLGVLAPVSCLMWSLMRCASHSCSSLPKPVHPSEHGPELMSFTYAHLKVSVRKMGQQGCCSCHC